MKVGIYEVERKLMKTCPDKLDYKVLCTHNDHNGYYGGFDVTVEFEQQKDDK